MTKRQSDIDKLLNEGDIIALRRIKDLIFSSDEKVAIKAAQVFWEIKHGKPTQALIGDETQPITIKIVNYGK